MATVIAPLNEEVEEIEGTSRQWQPKNWRNEYTEMVMLSSLGLSNSAISDEIFKRSGTRYGKQHISNVLNTKQGRALLTHISNNVREKVEASVPERLQSIALKTVERIESMINDDNLFAKAPFQVIDRGLRIAAHTGHIKDEEKLASRPTMMIPADSMKVLVDALAISKGVQVAHGEVVDADVVTTH